MSFWPYPRVLQLCFSLIEEISKVVYSIYPLIGTPSNDLCILLSFPVGRSVNPLGRNSLFPFFFRAVALPWSRWSLPSFFSVRFGSWSWARCSWPQAWFLESLPFWHFRPLPLAWSRLPLAKYFQSSRLAACAAPKSWTFWRRLEPLHEIEEPVLFRHIHNVQGELWKMAFTYSRMGPVCFRLINMADHNRAGTLNSAWNSSPKWI